MLRVHEGAGQTDQEPAEAREEDDPVGGFFLFLEDDLASDVVPCPRGGSYQTEDNSEGIGFPRQVWTVLLSQGGVGGGQVEILSRVQLQLHLRAEGVSKEESWLDDTGHPEVEKDPAHSFVQLEALPQQEVGEHHGGEGGGEDYGGGVT